MLRSETRTVHRFGSERNSSKMTRHNVGLGMSRTRLERGNTDLLYCTMLVDALIGRLGR
jgi:hypothetical protein